MYRLVTQVLQPFSLLFLLVVVAFAALWLRQRWTLRQGLPLAVGLLGLGALSTPAAAHLALGALERQHPPLAPETVAADAIVVLAGGVREATDPRRRPVLAEGSIVRTLCAARLYHAGSPRPVIVSGGSPSGPPLAAPLMAELLVVLGVPEDDVVVEEQSRDTYENARESARLLQAHGLTRPALVTEASHMPRSVRAFRAQGVAVIPAGCNYRASELDQSWLRFVPSAGGASLFQVAAHEWLGMAWYWLNGSFDLVEST